MDALASRAKADPVELRLRHLTAPRMTDVVKAAATTANWEERPPPKPPAKAPSATAAGIASAHSKHAVVRMNRRERPAQGAGETAISIVGSAIANAIFDATGARIRQVPLTAERIKAALSG